MSILDQANEFFTPLWRFVDDVPVIDVTRFPIIDEFWPHMSTVLIPSYLMLVFVGPRIMKNLRPIELNWLMTLWNLGLSLLSLCMFIGMARHILPLAFAHGFPWGWFSYLCRLPERFDHPLWNGPHVFWMWLFGLSKVAELGDTVFLVLRKRSVMFLHWYHHTTVMSFTWFAMWCLAGPGFLFAIMNSFVHIIMYFYYFLTSLGYYPSWGRYITQLQLLQMVVGVTASVTWTYYYYFTDIYASIKLPVGEWVVVSSIVMYGSYFYLFLMFYLNRHASKKPTVPTKKAQ